MRILTMTIALLAIACVAQADILVDFGVPDPNVDPMADPNQWLPSGAGWNTAWYIAGSQQVFNNLVDTTNTPTGASLTVSATGWGTDGPGGVDANNLYPWEAQIDYIGARDGNIGNLTFSGLTEPLYTVVLFGSRNSATTTRHAEYKVNGVTKVQDNAMNTTTKTYFFDRAPVGGQITVDVTGFIVAPDTYAYGYLNVLELIVPEPATLSLLAVGGLLAIRRRRR